MIRLYFYVEGQTEQEYAKRVLTNHLAGFGVHVMGAVLAANGRKHGQVWRGGGRRYQPMCNDLRNLLRQHRATKRDLPPCSTYTDFTPVFRGGTRPKNNAPANAC